MNAKPNLTFQINHIYRTKHVKQRRTEDYNMKIGIVGKGIVGNALFDGLGSIGHQMYAYDIKLKNSSLTSLVDCEIIYICVPTNSTTDGSCDTSNVFDTVNELNALGFLGIVAIKSTVEPTTTEKLKQAFPALKICFVPEFLREKSALTDFLDNHDVLIVGTDDTKIFKKIVNSHGSIPMNVIQVSPTEAEIAKYFSNVYNALRVTFANNVYEVCQKTGANYQHVLDAVTLRTSIEPNYLRCSDSLRGFSGKCLPKDSVAFARFASNLGLTDLKLLDAIVNDNKFFSTER